jgi:hypothetical protein
MKVMHLFYLDDLQLHSSSKLLLNVGLDIVSMFSRDICMSLGFDKCAFYVIGGKESHEGSQELPDSAESLPSLGLDPYKYFGISQHLLPHHMEMKRRLSEEFKRHSNIIWNSSLSAVNKIRCMAMFAAPVFTYSFGLVC